MQSISSWEEIGRVLYHRPVAMPLQDAARVEGVRFVMDLTRCFAEGALVCAHLCQAGDGHHVGSIRRGFAGAEGIRDAAQIA
jgi:hypothetical protein